MKLHERYLNYLRGMLNNRQFPLTYTEWLEKWEQEREVQ